MSTKSQEQSAKQIAGALYQAGFQEVTMEDLSGAYVVDFQVEPTQGWEKRNMRSSMHITEGGDVAGVSVRPPAAHESKGGVVRLACRSAVQATGRPSDWGFYLERTDGFGDPIDDVRPHVQRDGLSAPPANAKKAAKRVIAAVEAYRRTTASQ